MRFTPLLQRETLLLHVYNQSPKQIIKQQVLQALQAPNRATPMLCSCSIPPSRQVLRILNGHNNAWGHWTHQTTDYTHLSTTITCSCGSSGDSPNRSTTVHPRSHGPPSAKVARRVSRVSMGARRHRGVPWMDHHPNDEETLWIQVLA